MSDIYYVFIVLPIIIMGVLSFIFQSSVQEIEGQQFLINCPMPIYEGVATNVTIVSVRVEYDIQHDRDINGNATSNVQDKVGTRFSCTEDNGLFGVSTALHEYGSTEGFTGFPYGWFGYISHSITAIFEGAQPRITLLYLMVNAPAEATNLDFFSYITVILFAFLAIGIAMFIRG